MGPFFEYIFKLFTNPAFVIEFLIIFGVITYQIRLFGEVRSNIIELQSIFNNPLIIRNGFIDKISLKKKKKTINDVVFFNDDNKDCDDIFSDQNTLRISIAHTQGKGIIRRICDDINSYLLNNYGASVNFSMIKDIIDREVDLKDEEISNSITTPLYLGLGATMIGIILGLFSMRGLDDAQFANSIASLIDGVKLAMLGSLSGLGLTISLSSFFYKDAKKIVLQGKNQQISYLQAMLLPELLKAEESGISGLKSTIDTFARDTTSMASVLYNTTIKTESIIRIQQDIIKNQSDLIHKVDSMGISRITRANLELFDKFDKNAHSFNQFSNYLELMGRISNQLQDFASRTSGIDILTKNIDVTLSESKQLTEYLSSHFNKIDEAGGAALKAVDIADSHFKAVIDRLVINLDRTIESLKRTVDESSARFAQSMDYLNREIETRIGRINHNSIDHESKLTDIYNAIGSSLNTVTKDHLRQLENVYNEAIPKFDELKHLVSLPDIKDHLVNNKTDVLIELISEVNRSVIKVNEKVNSSIIENKMSTIEEILKKRNNSIRTKEHTPDDTVNEPIKSKKTPISILNAVRVVFSKKQ